MLSFEEQTTKRCTIQSSCDMARDWQASSESHYAQKLCNRKTKTSQEVDRELSEVAGGG